MAGELGYDPTTGQLVYNPDTGQLALNCESGGGCGPCWNVPTVTATVTKTWGGTTFPTGTYSTNPTRGVANDGTCYVAIEQDEPNTHSCLLCIAWGGAHIPPGTIYAAVFYDKHIADLPTNAEWQNPSFVWTTGYPLDCDDDGQFRGIWGVSWANDLSGGTLELS